MTGTSSSSSSVSVPNELPPGMLLPTRRKAVIMASLMLSLFLTALDQTIISVALPQVVADLGGLDLFAWPLTSYLLSITIVIPIFGRLSDIYGRKPFLLCGIVIFLTGSALCGLSGSMTELIVFRAFQGLGAGLIMSNVFSVLGDLFSPAERGRWIGLFAAVWALASVIGPLAGGTLTDELSWRWVFYINIPVGAIAIPFVLWQLPWYRSKTKRRVDYIGSVLLIAAGVPLLLALSWAGNQFEWGDLPVVLCLFFAVTFTALFIVAEHLNGESALLPTSLFRNRTYLIALPVTMMLGLAVFGAAQFLPLFLQGSQGLSATASGTVTFPLAVGLVLGAVGSGQIVNRFGYFRVVILTGALLIIIGALLLSRLTIDSQLNLTRVYVSVFGLGIGIGMPLVSLAVQNSVPHGFLGVASASNLFFRQLGGTIGVAIFGSVMISRFSSRLQDVFPVGLENLKDNPQILLDPDRLQDLRDLIDGYNPGMSDSVIRAAREALAPAVVDLFIATAIIMIIAFFVLLLLPRINMRTEADLLSEDGDGSQSQQ